jgi:hypothetical protein
MDTDALYATFTHPKVVTSMLLVGIGLGLALSVLMNLFWGQWFLPVAFAALALGTVIVYMVWLDRQEFQDGRETGIRDEQGQEKKQKPILVRPDSPPVIMDSPARFAIFSDTRVIWSMVLLAIGLGIALCVVIILFRGTWILPALIAALTIGTVVAYLCWLDGLD